MGEKFGSNPVTGTGSLTVPLYASPGRSGFGPQLSLAYDSGAGNGPFGFGWHLSLPSITRKTDKGLPQYDDVAESDTFLLSGAEDLVTVLQETPSGWIRSPAQPRTLNGKSYAVRRYQPRTEGLFARIERWSGEADLHDTFWRSISKDNVTTWYGRTADSRIADPVDRSRIFSWLICESYDDKGNAVVYEYKRENSQGVDAARAHERNRVSDRAEIDLRSANVYPSRIRYGNRTPYLPDLDAPIVAPAPTSWCFEVVFDYGDHDLSAPRPNEPGRVWPVRPDPFSSYRAAFEVRTYRLCRRVLMFHHFPGEAGIGNDCLVRSTDLVYGQDLTPVDLRASNYSFLTSVRQTGYKRDAAGYRSTSLPPIEFGYSKPTIDETVHEVDSQSLENLPAGLAGSGCHWVDLNGEGLSGILTEQLGSWAYKRNLSVVTPQGSAAEPAVARFGPIDSVGRIPSTANLAGGTQQLLDLSGGGHVALADFHGPSPGFFERVDARDWTSFQPFTALPVVDWGNPNLRFIDLTGDGRADILITEQEAVCWHESLGDKGFGDAQRVRLASAEEQGPRLVFGDGTESIFLADVSGDGLSDLVRIRNGDVSYWPNLGYGRFGAKVTMDDAPNFDTPDRFDGRRIRLADIDGSGTTDIIYLAGADVHIYFNLSGNAWSSKRALTMAPGFDSTAAVTVVDLLGNGTACLTWSVSLPGAEGRALRYVDLMGGQKPHLLVKVTNNLGAETRIEYAPSTRFYLQDERDGRPWITRLPFPVHCVARVVVTDKWRKTSFASTYSYHHGFFDGTEREFRGFGRVEQVDTESYGTFLTANATSPYITTDKTLYQPPIKTVTWYHTGASVDRERVLSQFAHEYFASDGFQEAVLPQPDLVAEALGADEWREALRACKGMVLRQEVYELDVSALEEGLAVPVRLFTSAYHNCHVRRLQPRGPNQYAVFLVAESEALTYHYDLDLRVLPLRPDPRIGHTFNLKLDEYGNVQQAVAVAYPRTGRFEDDAALAAGLSAALPVIRRVQREEMHVSYTETRYTDDFDPKDPDNYRLREPCEVLTSELTGISPEDADDSTDIEKRYFTLDELRRLRLSDVHQPADPRLTAVPEISYHALPKRTTPEKRIVEHVRMLFFKDAPADPGALKEPHPLGRQGRLGLPYETYKLALTEELLGAVFGSRLTLDVRGVLENPTRSGYLSGAALAARFPGIVTTGQYWIRSGVAGFATDAAQHFYFPERYVDPFGNVTILKHDAANSLFIESITDALGNITRVSRFDYRVLAPAEMKDINDNLSEVFFDVLGLPTALAVKGKGNEADNLVGFTDALANPTPAALAAFFNLPDLDEPQARTWLGDATTRFVYFFGETHNADGTIVWAEHPSCACGIVREQHVNQLAPGASSPLQTAFEYSDGMGAVIVKKIQAEPEGAGQPLRWIASGKTILNNKGAAVKHYEPYFSAPAIGHRFEEPREVGVTPVMYYDAIGRPIRTDWPDGTFSRVDFSPWHSRAFDQNDTVTEPGNAWFSRKSAAVSAEDRRAAQLAAEHGGTPSLTILDSLGRQVVAVSHNRLRNAAGVTTDERYVTFTKLDAEGKPLWIRDARGNLVMQYISPPAAANSATDPAGGFAPCYDIAGNLLFQHSMDAGSRWLLNDAAGKAMFGWNTRGHVFRTDYDELHRPIASFVRGADPLNINREIQFDKTVYGDSPGSDVPVAARPQLNLRGMPYQHYDTSGVVTTKGRNALTGNDEAYDFKGNLLRSQRQLVSAFKITADWAGAPALEPETFRSSARYDALNRPLQIVTPHSDRAGSTLNVIRHGYSEAGRLQRVDVWLERAAEPTALLDPGTADLHAVRNIDYDAKGQRTRIEYNDSGHPIITSYLYEADTFRLARLVTTRPAHAQADKRTLQDLAYTYDPVGNITHIHDDAQQPAYFGNTAVLPSNSYIYDALYRLIRADGREHAAQNNVQRDAVRFEPILGVPFPNSPEALQRYVEDYEYDAVGNILSWRHTGGAAERWVRRYQYAVDSNRMLATRVPGDPAQLATYTSAPGYASRYSYDAHGNMTSMPHLPVMAWDFRDQLVVSQRQVVGAGAIGEKTYYVYDTDGERVRKVTETASGARKDERIYLGGVEVYREYAADAVTVALERETLHVMDDKKRVALVETRTRPQGVNPAPRQLVRFQLGNHLGSAIVEVDQDAEIISYEEYHPYGTTAYQAARSLTAAAKRFRYTGKELDEESGLYYHGARYYASWLARWTSADPAGLVDGLNVFGYARFNPIGGKDPSGLDTVTMKEVDVTGRTPDQVAADIKSKTGMRAYDAAKAVGVTPGANSTWASDTEAALEQIGAVAPAEGPPPAAQSQDYDGPSIDQLNEPYDRRHRYIRTPVDDPLQYELTEIYATPEEAGEKQLEVDTKEASDRAAAALAAGAARGGSGATSRDFISNAGPRPGAPVGRPRTESANPVRANPWFGKTRPEATVPDTSTPYRKDPNREHASRGGLVWTSPQTLAERIALQAAMSGEGEPMELDTFGDPKYQGVGWQKVKYRTDTADGNKIEIHYMRNTKTGQTGQFKFVSRGQYKKPTVDPKVSSGDRP